MSLLHTIDIVCDAPECSFKTPGVTSSYPASGRIARRKATRAGWVSRRIEGRLYDLCPSHLTYHPPTKADRYRRMENL